jgi:hypothetical protein
VGEDCGGLLRLLLALTRAAGPLVRSVVQRSDPLLSRSLLLPDWYAGNAALAGALMHPALLPLPLGAGRLEEEEGEEGVEPVHASHKSALAIAGAPGAWKHQQQGLERALRCAELALRETEGLHECRGSWTAARAACDGLAGEVARRKGAASSPLPVARVQPFILVGGGRALSCCSS